MRRFCIKISAILLPLAVWSAIIVDTANAQSCNLNRKSIVYGHTMCGPNGCEKGGEKIDVVGNKAVHYHDEAIGDIYLLGNTVNFCDPHTDFYRPKLCQAGGEPLRAVGHASFDGAKFELRTVQSGDRGKITTTIQIHVFECATCELLNVMIQGVRPNGQVFAQSMMTRSEFCRIIPNPSHS